MSRSEMTMETFEDLAFTHGAALEGWPVADRAAAEALLAANPAAAEALSRVASLEADLWAARAPDPEPTEALLARILSDAAEVRPSEPVPAEPAAPARSGWRIALSEWFSPAAACAASAAFGLWLGYAAPTDVAEAAGLALGIEAANEFAMLEEIEPVSFGAFDAMVDAE